ncbi:unnamed protein product [Adineta ricciae]|uniref:C1q domain-containing protein n=1 Tax=Adineta ricciae TaxID=249248 RepID=A0A814FKT8_ADIRI|nr:unnamed protein product [Adineta ricciae]
MTTAYYKIAPPSNTHYNNLGSQVNQGAHNLGLGPLTTHLTARRHPTANSDEIYDIQQQPKYYLRDKTTGSHRNEEHYAVGNNQYETSSTDPMMQQTATAYHLLSASQVRLLDPENQVSSGHHRSPLNGNNSHESNNPTMNKQKNKPVPMRATAIQLTNGTYPMNKKQPLAQITQASLDTRDNGIGSKTRRNMTQSLSVPNYYRGRRDDLETEDNTSSIDENSNNMQNQNRTYRANRKNNSSLPPVRRGQGPPTNGPNFGHSLAPGHPFRRKFLPNDDYASDQHSSYNESSNDRKGFNRNNKDYEDSAQHYNDRDMYEYPQHERNDLPKQRSHPSVHEALYLQQSISTDSYLENQRRRAVRESQGYYFPYKKYTLKDYKDLQKTESQFNPYGSYKAENVDRKELARKRMQYASKIERPVVDTSEDYRSPRDISSRKSFGQSRDSDGASKRNRALEYAKFEVSKHRPTKTSKQKKPDPTEQYINSLFPEVDDDEEDEGDEDWSEYIPFTVLSLSGSPGTPGVMGKHKIELLYVFYLYLSGSRGPQGPQGISGPPGRDGFTERPVSFYAELSRLFVIETANSTVHPWRLYQSYNFRSVPNYFSAETGIFTAPADGLYQFFLTVSVSRSKALINIAKNGQYICPIRIDSTITVNDKTIGWGWTSSSIDCFIYCHIGDQVSVIGSNEGFTSQIYGYSYTTFSGYMFYSN